MFDFTLDTQMLCNYTGTLKDYSPTIVLGYFSGYRDAVDGYKQRFCTHPKIGIAGLSAQRTLDIQNFVLKNVLGTPSSALTSSLGLASYWIGGLAIPFLYSSHSPDSVTFFVVDRLKDAVSKHPLIPIEEKLTILPCFYPEFKTYGFGKLEQKQLLGHPLSDEESKKIEILQSYRSAFESYKKILSARKKYASHGFFQEMKETNPLNGSELEVKSKFWSLFFDQTETQKNDSDTFEVLKFFSVDVNHNEKRMTIEIPAGYDSDLLSNHKTKLCDMLKDFKSKDHTNTEPYTLQIVQEWSRASDAKSLKFDNIPDGFSPSYLLLNPEEAITLESENIMTLGVDNPCAHMKGTHLSLPRTEQSIQRWVNTIFAFVSKEIQVEICLFMLGEILKDGNLRFLLNPKKILSAMASLPNIALKITLWPVRLIIYGLSLIWLKVTKKDKKLFEMPTLDSEPTTPLRYPSQIEIAKEKPRKKPKNTRSI